MKNVSRYKEYLNKEKGKQDVLSSQLKTAEESLVALTQRSKDILEAQLIVQNVAMATQAQVVFKIQSIVNKVLQAVFPEYSFELKFEIKRGKSEAQLKFFKGVNEVNLMDGTGGGVTDIAAIGLRLAIWSLSDTADILILDEPTKMLSLGLQPRLAQVIKELATKLDLQIIMISHSQPLNDVADNLIRITQGKSGVSQVA